MKGHGISNAPDYIETATEHTVKQMNDIQCFINVIRRIIESGVDLDENEKKFVLAALPSKAKGSDYV